jgi:cytochrome P450
MAAQPALDIKTPPAKFSPIASLLSGQSFQYLAARLGARIGKCCAGPLRFGRTVLAIRHADVADMLRRDLDFRIEPINGAKIEEVNGHFVLGLDRSATLVKERHALYSALAAVDLEAFEERARKRAAERARNLETHFDAIADLARPLAARGASDLFGVGAHDLSQLAEIARAIFAHTFLNLGNDAKIRQRALNAAPLLKDMLAQEIKRRRSTQDLGNDLMGQLLRQQQVDDDGVRRTIGGMLVGSIDTTTSAVAKIVCVALGDPQLRGSMIGSSDRGEDTYGWCLEALRKWPHNPILLRQISTDTMLGGSPVRSGDRAIAWTHAAMLDPAAFPEPLLSIGNRDRAAYLHFGQGLHPCAGRVINAIQIPLLVQTLLNRGIFRDGRMKWAGPFPDQLPVKSGKA